MLELSEDEALRRRPGRGGVAVCRAVRAVCFTQSARLCSRTSREAGGIHAWGGKEANFLLVSQKDGGAGKEKERLTTDIEFSYLMPIVRTLFVNHCLSIV